MTGQEGTDSNCKGVDLDYNEALRTTSLVVLKKLNEGKRSQFDYYLLL